MEREIKQIKKFIIIALFSVLLLPAAQWVGNKVSGGWVGTATTDLDMANNDIAMGTGLIGFDATASEGLSFDTSGNVTFEANAASFILPQNNDGATPTLAIGAANMGIHAYDGTSLFFSISGNTRYRMTSDLLRNDSNTSWGLYRTAATATAPPLLPNNGDTNTGYSSAAADQPCVVGGAIEAQRWIPVADTDSDDTDVLLTGVTGFHGLAIVIVLTDNISAIFHVDNVTVTGDISLNALITSTKDNAATYNFYYDTDQFKLQNKVGDNKSVKVVFWALPTT